MNPSSGPATAALRSENARESGTTLLEMIVVMVIFLILAAAVGSAFGTGGEVYGDGLLRADLGANARRVMNRILAEIEETQSDSPDFAVGTNFITYNQVEAISAAGPTFGPERRIIHNGNTNTIAMIIPSQRLVEEISGQATGLTFALDGSRLTVTASITKTNAHGTEIVHTVTGDVNVHR